MKSLSTRTFIAAAALATLVACGGNDPTAEIPLQATLIGRYAHSVSAGMSEIVAMHTASNSVFITVDTASAPTSFQRISLRNLSSYCAWLTRATTSNLRKRR